MDLSAVIFVVLALAWAVYLIPKALQHHDEMASDRLVEGHSERVRILRRRSTPTETVEVEVETTVAAEVEVPSRQQSTERVPRELTPAGTAARRRRRVLALLFVAVATVAGLAAAGIVPWWSTAAPGSLIVVFLVIARLSVRSAQRASRARRRPAERAQLGAPVAAPIEAEQDHVDVALHDDREDVQQMLAEDGSLWDPLPMTLPTYVSKAKARRTVRTIELTGMQSSGHDQDDTELAREAVVTAEPAADDAERRAAGA